MLGTDGKHTDRHTKRAPNDPSIDNQRINKSLLWIAAGADFGASGFFIVSEVLLPGLLLGFLESLGVDIA